TRGQEVIKVLDVTQLINYPVSANHSGRVLFCSQGFPQTGTKRLGNTLFGACTTSRGSWLMEASKLAWKTATITTRAARHPTGLGLTPGSTAPQSQSREQVTDNRLRQGLISIGSG